MKRLTPLFTVLVGIFMVAMLVETMSASGELVRVEIPRQRVDVDVDGDGSRDLFQVDLTVYEDGTVTGRTDLAGRSHPADGGRLFCGDEARPQISYSIPITHMDIWNHAPPLSFLITPIVTEALDIVMLDMAGESHAFEAAGDLIWMGEPCP